MFGKRVGGFLRRAEEVVAGDLKVAPELRPIFEALVSARHADSLRLLSAFGRATGASDRCATRCESLDRIRRLDAQVRAAARRDRTVRLFMTAPGIGPITALAVAPAFDDPARFRRSSSAGAYLGLTPRRYGSGEVSYNGRSSKRGDQMTRTCLYKAANAVITRTRQGSALREGAVAIAKRTGPSKARVALARTLAVILHAMGRSGTPCQARAAA